MRMQLTEIGTMTNIYIYIYIYIYIKIQWSSQPNDDPKLHLMEIKTLLFFCNKLIQNSEVTYTEDILGYRNSFSLF